MYIQKIYIDVRICFYGTQALVNYLMIKKLLSICIIQHIFIQMKLAIKVEENNRSLIFRSTVFSNTINKYTYTGLRKQDITIYPKTLLT